MTDTQTTVVHVHAQYDIYIGRAMRYPNIKDPRIRAGSILANPFRIKDQRGTPTEQRGRAIALYALYADLRMQSNPEFADAVRASKGKRLGCWCAPGACHGQVIAQMADKE